MRFSGASIIGRLTAFVSNTTMALVEDDEVLGSRQLDMGNSALKVLTGGTQMANLGEGAGR